MSTRAKGGAAPSEKEQKAAPTEVPAGFVPVVVTTEHRGVFFGFVDPIEADGTSKVIRLKRCRMVIYWSADARGVMGLAVKGPSSSSKVGPAVPSVKLHDVTSVSTCTEESVQAWEAEPWGR